MDNIKEALISKINLTDKEAQIFLFLIINGESTVASISAALKLTLEESEQELCNLLEKGLILEPVRQVSDIPSEIFNNKRLSSALPKNGYRI